MGAGCPTVKALSPERDRRLHASCFPKQHQSRPSLAGSPRRVGALLTGHASQLRVQSLFFARAVNGLFIAVWVYTLWTWRRVTQQAERHEGNEQR